MENYTPKKTRPFFIANNSSKRKLNSVKRWYHCWRKSILLWMWFCCVSSVF